MTDCPLRRGVSLQRISDNGSLTVRYKSLYSLCKSAQNLGLTKSCNNVPWCQEHHVMHQLCQCPNEPWRD